MKKLTKALAAIMLMTAVVFTIGCNNTKSNAGDSDGGGKSNNNESNVVDGHEYVDLGLPSGTLWATCNVGANSPEEYGDYFAWGETESKDIYMWGNYKYIVDDTTALVKKYTDEIEDDIALKKYTGDFEYYGFTDHLSILQPSDDAASANWGSGWCMPTKEQWEELIRYTNSIWTNQNGINGWLFTGKHETVLFLPAAGGKFIDFPPQKGVVGNYWSSSLGEFSPEEACFLGFSWDSSFGSCDDYIGVDDNERYFGISVRAVRSAH